MRLGCKRAFLAPLCRQLRRVSRPPGHRGRLLFRLRQTTTPDVPGGGTSRALRKTGLRERRRISQTCERSPGAVSHDSVWLRPKFSQTRKDKDEERKIRPDTGQNPPKPCPRFNETHADDLRLQRRENHQLIPEGHIQPLGEGGGTPVVRNVEKGLILMRQEAEKGRRCPWVRAKMAAGAHHAPLHHTMKELAHFILPTPENVKGGEGEEE